MNTLLKTLGVTAISTMLTAGIAMPAHAASFPLGQIDVGPDSNEWRWETASALSLSGPWNSTWDNSGNSSTWDSTTAVIFGPGPEYVRTDLTCADPADLSTATDGSGDQILTCDPQVGFFGNGELAITAEFRFYADGQTVRQRYIINNTGTTAVTGHYFQVEYNAFQDSGTNISYTDTAGVIGNYATDYSDVSTIETNELNYVWVTDDRSGEESAPVVKYAIGRAGSASPMFVDPANGWTSGGQGDGDDMAYLPYELPSIAAGQTVEYVFLAKVYLFDDGLDSDVTLNGWEEGTKGAIDLAVADTALQSDAIVYAGIADRSKVLNWTPAGLAETGADPLPLGLGAFLALAGGIAIVLRRRFAN